MKFKRKDSQTVKILLLLLVLVIGIGYAYLTSNLSITGATAVAGNTWDIHFENVQISPGSVEATTPATINPSDNTRIDYAVLLSRPGKYYEFTVDMVNSGSLPGKVSLVDFSGISPEMEDVVDYSVVYTNNNSPVAINDVLSGGSSKNIKVRLLFKEDIEEEDLLDVAEDLSLSFEIVFVQSEEDEEITNAIIQQLKTENSSCFTKYEGQVTDQVGQTVTAQNVYFNKCADKRNIIFGGYCWQMIRTTETGGIKMIYNGEPVDGKCESSRADHKGIVQDDEVEDYTMNGSYLFGSSFTYDLDNDSFTLVETSTGTWDDYNYEDVIGKYTCMSNSTTCTTIYNINGYVSDNEALVTKYTIDTLDYAEIGKSSFNANSDSPATVGYMFNKVYNVVLDEIPVYGDKTIKFGSEYIYNPITNRYTLTGITEEIAYSSTELKQDNLHYTCLNASGECVNIYYVTSYWSRRSIVHIEYISISENKGVEDALNEMLFDNDVNRHNSSIKGVVDSWYAQNLFDKTNYLEDAVYCNARNIVDNAGWDPDGPFGDGHLDFNSWAEEHSLGCLNGTDQFSTANNLAKLAYPVGLINSDEVYYLSSTSLLATKEYYWNLTPLNFGGYFNSVWFTDLQGGSSEAWQTFMNVGVRPVVSLKSIALITKGSGSEIDPWVVE